MERASRLLPRPLTQEEKKTAQEKRQKRWFEKIEDAQYTGLLKEVIDLMVLVADGGPCPLCGKLWKRVEYNNAYAIGFYYEPDCRCWPFCSRCSRTSNGHEFKHWLYFEYAAGSLIRGKCPECGSTVRQIGGEKAIA